MGVVVLLQLAVWARPFKGLASFNLALYTVLAGVGLLEGAASFPLAIGTTAALAYWELIEFRHNLRPQIIRPQIMRHVSPAGSHYLTEIDPALSMYHLQSVGLAAGLGLLLTGIASRVSLSLPFGVVVAFVLVLFLALDRALRWFALNHEPVSGDQEGDEQGRFLI
jgi:hypothetical protein